jgi:hypothetical protein
VTKSRDLAVFLGPPGAVEQLRKIEEWVQSSGREWSEVWVEYAHALIEELFRRDEAEARSTVEKVLSGVLGSPIVVGVPFLTTLLREDGRHPGFVLRADQIAGVGGAPLELDARLGDLIAAFFGAALQSDWVYSSISPLDG